MLSRRDHFSPPTNAANTPPKPQASLNHLMIEDEMSDQAQQEKAPFLPPSWLLAAARKRSAPPSQGLLDRVRYERIHSQEVEEQRREDASRAGRDPDWLAKQVAAIREQTLSVRLAQPTRQVSNQAVASMQTGNQGMGLIDHADAMEIDNTTSASPAISTSTPPLNLQANIPATSAPPDIARSPLPPTSTKNRLGPRSQVVKPSQPNISRAKYRLKPTNPAKSTSGATTQDTPPVLAESSASGAAREAQSTAAGLPNEFTPALAQQLGSYQFPTRAAMPAWYTSVNTRLLERRRPRPQELAAIDALKDCIRRCESERQPVKLAKEYNTLRDEIHKAEIKLKMDKEIVKKTRILEAFGLPRIFSAQANFPWDLKADAWNLYERWMNEDLKNDILRGIVTKKSKDRNGDQLDSAYREKHLRDPKVYGDNGAVLGQWWPTQLCSVRDGIHGAAQGGIYGNKDAGAYSIVLSGGGYHDRDEGDTIEYSGTDGSDFTMTTATQAMITSSKLGNHIRVLRSSQLLKSNQYRPSRGLRYDGLYQVKSYTELSAEQQIYRFHLERIPDQQPIRFEGVAKRPTVFEEEAYDMCKGRI